MGEKKCMKENDLGKKKKKTHIKINWCYGKLMAVSVWDDLHFDRMRTTILSLIFIFDTRRIKNNKPLKFLF